MLDRNPQQSLLLEFVEGFGRRTTSPSVPENFASSVPKNFASSVPENFASSQRKTIPEIIQGIRPASREVYARYLIELLNSGEMSVNDFVQKFQVKPQNIHAVLKYFCDLGAVVREKRKARQNSLGRGTKEYYYSISPEVADEEIKYLRDKVATQSSYSNDSLNQDCKEDTNTSTEQRFDTTQVMSTEPNKEPDEQNHAQLASSYEAQLASSGEEDAEFFRKMLPPFNPSWTLEAQAEWLSCYRELMLMRKNQNG